MTEPHWRTGLSPAEQDGVRRLIDAATAADGVAPVGEQVLLQLDSPSADHLLAIDPDGSVVGYLNLARGSAVAELVLRTDDRPSAARLAALETVTAHAFGQRRKMLRSSLKALGGAALCEAAGVDADARAETIPVDGFLALAKVVEA